MKFYIAKQIVEKVNHPLLKLFKAYETDYEGYGKYKVGVETEWGIIYWGRNTRSHVGSPRVKDGFRLIAKSDLLQETFKLLQTNIGNSLTYSEWNTGGNRDFTIEVHGIEQMEEIDDFFGVNGGEDQLKIVSDIIRNHFIPECKKYLTYCDIYNNYYEPEAEIKYWFETHEKYDCSAGITTAEHYRLILKAIVKSQDFNEFKKILFDHYSTAQKQELQPYFITLDKLYQNNSFKACKSLIEPKLAYVEIEDILNANLKATRLNLDRLINYWVPYAIEYKKKYDPNKEFPSERSKDDYKRRTYKKLEAMYLARYIPCKLRIRKWENGLAYMQSVSQFSMDELFKILSQKSERSFIDSYIKEVKQKPYVDSEVLDEWLSKPPFNEIDEDIVFDRTKNNYSYHHQLYLNDKKIKSK